MHSKTRKINAIKNGRIIMDDLVVENKILLFNERILEWIEPTEIKTFGNIQEYITKKYCVHPQDIEIIDAKGQFVSPGFTDIHIHGMGGFDVMDGTSQAIENIGKLNCSSGVTSYLPTTMTQDTEKILSAFDTIQELMTHQRGSNFKGARILGVHMEGPFISSTFKGAQDDQFVAQPNMKLVENHLNIIKVITLAPELIGGIDFIKRVSTESDIICSMGHTGASFEQALLGIKAGIKSATHMFNAMSALHHRDPGAVGAVLTSDIYFEMIADTIHTHPAMLSFVADIKGTDKMILVSDAMRATCMKCGQYELGGQKVTVTNESARLADGTLAGSVLRMNQAIKNMVENTSYDLPTIINMASANPAKLIGCFAERGSISCGKYADITVFNDAFEISRTYVEGKLEFHKEEK